MLPVKEEGAVALKTMFWLIKLGKPEVKVPNEISKSAHLFSRRHNLIFADVARGSRRDR
jgi:hypothetical protein